MYSRNWIQLEKIRNFINELSSNIKFELVTKHVKTQTKNQKPIWVPFIEFSRYFSETPLYLVFNNAESIFALSYFRIYVRVHKYKNVSLHFRIYFSNIARDIVRPYIFETGRIPDNNFGEKPIKYRFGHF